MRYILSLLILSLLFVNYAYSATQTIAPIGGGGSASWSSLGGLQTSVNVEGFGTGGSSGTAPVSNGSGGLLMTDIATQAELNAAIPPIAEKDIMITGYTTMFTEGETFTAMQPNQPVAAQRATVVFGVVGTGGATGVRIALYDGTNTYTCDVNCTTAVQSCNFSGANFADDATIQVRFTSSTDCTVNPQNVNINVLTTWQ